MKRKTELRVKKIFIIGCIDDEMNRTVLFDLHDTEWEKDKITDLYIYISSGGGILSDCFSMLDTIEYLKESLKIKVTTFGLGEVGSCAFFMFLLGDVRYLFEKSRIFVHEHIVIEGPEMTYSEKQRNVKTDEKEIYSVYRNWIAKRLKISNAKASVLLRKNDWLTKKEITNFGITTGELNPNE